MTEKELERTLVDLEEMKESAERKATEYKSEFWRGRRSGLQSAIVRVKVQVKDD